jgi:8-oxo-dGTP pyrophosphatase MutT (NUDIX family)
MHRPKRVLTSKVLVKNPWFAVRQDAFVRADNKKAPYYTIISDPFVIICGLSADRKKVVMVKNWRYPVKRYLIEFPMGWREKHETPLMAAKREFAEEARLAARKWVSLGWFYLAPGISTQRGYIFVAEGLQKLKRIKPSDEVVTVAEMSLAKLRSLLASGQIMDAPTSLAASRLLNYVA